MDKLIHKNKIKERTMTSPYTLKLIVSCLFSIESLFNPFKDHVIFCKSGNHWITKSKKSSFYFPALPHAAQIYKVREGYGKLMVDKYTLDGFVEIGENDLVFDVGAFVGVFFSCFKDRERSGSIGTFFRNFQSLLKNIHLKENILAMKS